MCLLTSPYIPTGHASEFQSTSTCRHLFIPCNTVESLNKGHLIWSSLSVLCKEVVLFEGSEMCWDYRKKIFCDLQLCLCREIVLISERPLSKIPMYVYVHNIICTYIAPQKLSSIWHMSHMHQSQTKKLNKYYNAWFGMRIYCGVQTDCLQHIYIYILRHP